MGRKKISKERREKIIRAGSLLGDYQRKDKKHGRGKGDLTCNWIVDNIFTKPCAHCGKTGWKIIGCNRLDNDKPHTMDNVEPCCRECNLRQVGKGGIKTDKINKITGEVLATFPNMSEAAKDIGVDVSNISRCVYGKIKTSGKYVWKGQKKEDAN